MELAGEGGSLADMASQAQARTRPRTRTRTRTPTLLTPQPYLRPYPLSPTYPPTPPPGPTCSMPSPSLPWAVPWVLGQDHVGPPSCSLPHGWEVGPGHDPSILPCPSESYTSPATLQAMGRYNLTLALTLTLTLT